MCREFLITQNMERDEEVSENWNQRIFGSYFLSNLEIVEFTKSVIDGAIFCCLRKG